MAYLTAGDIKLIDPLKSQLSGYNQTAQGSLANALGAAKTSARSGASASGRLMGNYVDESLGRANLNASEGIYNSIAGSLGDTSMQDVLAERDHQRKLDMARRIGSAMSPSVAQQILSGVSSGANLAFKGKGLYDSLGMGGGTDWNAQAPTYSSPLYLNPSSGYEYPSALKLAR